MHRLVSAIARPSETPPGEPRPPHDTSGPPSASLRRLLADRQPEPDGPGFQSSI